LSATLKSTADGWQLTVQNQTPKAVSTAQLIVNGKLHAVGEIAAGQTKTVQITNDTGISLQDFVRDPASIFESVIQKRQSAFGRSGGGRIEDLPTASMVSSFIGQVPTAQGGVNFVAPPGLDLSDAVAHGQAVLLAWSPGASPVPPVNQFKSKRSASNTLWRVPVQISPGP